MGGSANAPCHTVITRAEFEKLSVAIQPNMPPTTKHQLATTYPRLLVMSHEAEQRGLDKQDHFQEMITFARLQILAQELVRNIQERAAQVPDKDIDVYYRDHLTSFEKATLERILVPVKRQTEATGGSTHIKDNPTVAARIEQEKEAAMAKEAERLRERAVAGEDFAKLQRAAYDAAGVTSAPPSPRFTNWRRASLPAAHLSAFDLKVGEVSAVISDRTGHYIYKLDSKEMEPREDARAEIQSILEKQRTREMMKEVQESITTEVNQAYFGTPATPNSPDTSLVKPDSDDQ
jgi:parvulin-like peptidyl-prolyl isomerase